MKYMYRYVEIQDFLQSDSTDVYIKV